MLVNAVSGEVPRASNDNRTLTVASSGVFFSRALHCVVNPDYGQICPFFGSLRSPIAAAAACARPEDANASVLTSLPQARTETLLMRETPALTKVKGVLDMS